MLTDVISNIARKTKKQINMEGDNVISSRRRKKRRCEAKK